MAPQAREALCKGARWLEPAFEEEEEEEAPAWVPEIWRPGQARLPDWHKPANILMGSWQSQLSTGGWQRGLLHPQV